MYKFNLVLHSRVEWRGPSVVTLGSDKLPALTVTGSGAQAAIRYMASAEEEGLSQEHPVRMTGAARKRQ